MGENLSLWHAVIHPITRYFRQKRGKFILSNFPDITDWKICDLGGSRHFWEKLEIENMLFSNITIYNINSSETDGYLSEKGNEIQVLIYDGYTIPAKDGEFDLLVCNSVLEHIALHDRRSLVVEMMRVAKHVFVQTPAYSFPIEPHFIMPFVHWFPRKLGYWCIHFSPWRLLSRPAKATILDYWSGTHLLTKGEIRSLFPTANIRCEKILGLTKSFYIIE